MKRKNWMPEFGPTKKIIIKRDHLFNKKLG
jgi:hypothetical protein